MKRTILLTITYFLSFYCIAQVTNEGTPLSWSLAKNKLSAVKAIKLPKVDLNKLKAEDEINDKIKTKPWRFGFKHKVDFGIKNSGSWTKTNDGGRIWKALFVSEGALSINFIFDEFYMPEGANVYLYSDDKKDLLGAYTQVQNQKNRQLGTWLVKGDSVWIEYYEPKEVFGEGKLNITSVVHGYRNRESHLKKIGDSGNCNHDVDCSIGTDMEHLKEHNKKAVALILSNGNDWCTGTLINNTKNDKKPYLLTANHCIESQNTNNWSFRFGWESTNVSCANQNIQSEETSVNMTISGAILRANNTESDVALIELNNSIPVSWNRVWAGWDKTNIAPSMTFGIHHPSGDVMKVSRDNDAPTKVRDNVGGTSPKADCWLINGGSKNGWEIGVTEGGSSGSALFDPNGRIIGQLYGGGAACSGTDDNGGSDLYGRFATSWDKGSTASTRLKDWLDPDNQNPNTLNSLPSLSVPNLDSKIFSSVETPRCNDENPKPIITIKNLGTSTINSIVLQWNIDGQTSQNINWNGSLIRNTSTEIELPSLNLSKGLHTLNVTTLNVNGGTDFGDTSNDIIINKFNYKPVSKHVTNQIKLSLTTDQYPEETSWELIEVNSNTVIDSGGPYDANTDKEKTFEETFNVDANKCYVFKLKDSGTDGICCTYGSGSYKLTTDDGTIIFDGNGRFRGEQSTSISIVSTLSKNDEILEKNITIFPNPTSGLLNIQINNSVRDLKYEVINLLGQNLQSGIIRNNEPINLGSLANAVYLVKITDVERNASLTKKIVISK